MLNVIFYKIHILDNGKEGIIKEEKEEVLNCLIN